MSKAEVLDFDAIGEDDGSLTLRIGNERIRLSPRRRLIIALELRDDLAGGGNVARLDELAGNVARSHLPREEEPVSACNA